MRRAIVLLTALATALALAVPAIGANGKSPQGATLSDELTAALEEAAGNVDVLISTTNGDYADLVASIEAAGGTVSHEFKYADGLAASVPRASIDAVASHPSVTHIGVDAMRSAPGLSLFTGGQPTRAAATSLDAAIANGQGFPLDSDFSTMSLGATELSSNPATYWGYTADSMNAIPVWLTGNFGQDSTIAVIDTGVQADHFMFDDGFGNSRVVGGVDLSTDVGTAFEGATVATNYYHGSHVAGIAAGNGALCIPDGDLLVDSIELYTGENLDSALCGGDNLVPLLGMAPLADIYAIKVFDHTGGSTPESTVIAGIEYAIDLRVSGVQDIDVINMSLGGWTGFDGRDLEDQAVDYATSVGISVVSAASNDGPYSMSINSPGTANTSITAGAIAHPVNTRVFWDQNYGILGVGDLLYVDDNPQVIYFSSRGPTADGRDKPTASAIGVFVLSAFTGAGGTGLAFASGTSMATPGLAGVAALLNQYGETVGASPYDIKQAIVAGSHPVPGFDELDQGAGLINAADAYDALQADGNLGQAQPSLSNGYSATVVKPKGTLIQNVVNKNGTSFDVTLDPGMSNHYYFALPPNAERVTIDVSNVELGIDPIEFNSFEVGITGGVRDTLSPYIDSTNVYGDASMVIEDLHTEVSGDVFGVITDDLPLMPGYWKLVIENDWTSYDTISGTFTVNVETGDNSAKPDESYSGKLDDHESAGFFEVGYGPNGVDLQLSWSDDYKRYPASDMDLVVAWFDTDGALHFNTDAASISSPEQVSIDATNIDQVFVLVDAFNTYGTTQAWQLDVDYR